MTQITQWFILLSSNSLHSHTTQQQLIAVACVKPNLHIPSTTAMPITNHHNHLHTPLRQPASTTSSSFTSKILLLLTLLPVSLATIAFILQWRGGITDPATLLSPHGAHNFPGMDSSPLSPLTHTTHSSDCLNLGRSSSPSFPYYHNWKLDFGDSLTPKVRFLASLNCGVCLFFVVLYDCNFQSK